MKMSFFTFVSQESLQPLARVQFSVGRDVSRAFPGKKKRYQYYTMQLTVTFDHDTIVYRDADDVFAILFLSLIHI